MAQTTDLTFEKGVKVDLKPEEVFRLFLRGLTITAPKRLLLINPPQVPRKWFDPQVARLGRYFIYPPTGLLCVAAVARLVKPDLEVGILDLNYELLRMAHSEPFDYDYWKELIAKELDFSESVWVGVSWMFSHTSEVFFEIADFIGQFYPHVSIIVGGVQATYDYREILKSSACDMVVRGEGELQFQAFFESVLVGKPQSIPWGAACKLPNGRIYEFDPARQGPVPVDIDIIPYYSLIEIGEYHKYGSLGAFSRYTGRDKPFCAVISNRGCRARCAFCTVRDFNGFGVRERSPQGVISEIKYLWNKKGIRQIDWLDDDLLYDEPRAIELFKGLAEEIPGFAWICNNGLIAYAITDELLKWMVKSGLRAFTIGIESGNSHMLRKIKKPATKPKLREAKKRFDQYPQVLATANFIIGFPNETFREMLDTFEFALELELDWARYFICQPLRGTEMFSAFQALGDDRVDKRSEDMNPAKARLTSEFLNPVKTKPASELLKSGGDGKDEKILHGMEIFNIDPDDVPSQRQVKEIWFTFHLITNILRNRNLSPSGNPAKAIKWVGSIFSAYPYEASLCAFLAYGHKLLGNDEKGKFYDKRFYEILSQSEYWRGRVEQFPEIWRLLGRKPDARVG